MKLEDIANNEELLEIGRLSVENELIQLRNLRIFQIRNNGLVIKEEDGTGSNVIRFGPETCLKIGLQAIAKHLSKTGGMVVISKNEYDTLSLDSIVLGVLDERGVDNWMGSEGVMKEALKRFKDE